MGESNVAIDPAIGGYGAADIYLGEFSPQCGIRDGVPPRPTRTPIYRDLDHLSGSGAYYRRCLSDDRERFLKVEDFRDSAPAEQTR